MSNTEQKQETPEDGCGRMKSHKANLEIEIGGDGKGGGNEMVTRFYNSAVLANKSKYIDTMLASEMKESETYKISFSDTSVETFDRALTFVLSSAQARKMTVEDVVAVAKFYDQYDFADGRDLCEQVLLEYFESLPSQEKEFSLNVDLMVEAVAVSFAANLTLAYEKGGVYIKERVAGNHHLPFYKAMFNQNHIKILVPVLADLVEKDNTCLKWVTRDTVDKQTIENPLFPKLFTAQAAKRDAFSHLMQDSKIHVSGSGIADVDGDFVHANATASFCRSCSLMVDSTLYQEVCVAYLVNSKGWEIKAQNGNQRITLWRARFSASLSLPPKEHWDAVHQIAEGSSLKVEFKKPAMG